jgi:rubrerythrin
VENNEKKEERRFKRVTDLEKLKHLLKHWSLKHWSEHNETHIQTYTEWAGKAESLGKEEVSKLLNQIAEETKRIDELLRKALGSL